jgi:peptide-methionine (S)-S-oxide reductase
MSSRSINLLRVGAVAAAVAVAAPFAISALQAPSGSAVAVAAAAQAKRLPPPAIDLPAARGPQTIILAGGCFWGVQGVFQHVRGVQQAVSGYAGGNRMTAKYELVSSGVTRHAEAVKITYDPSVVSLGELLHIFFSVATDPTQVNMQFPDKGAQYRNAIFYETADQKRVAEAYIAQLNGARAFSKPIATKVEKNTGFYAAEAYHQDYLTKHPDQPYIATYDLPKVADLKRMFPARYSAKPMLVGAKG